jgi:hypothetical protein
MSRMHAKKIVKRKVKLVHRDYHGKEMKERDEFKYELSFRGEFAARVSAGEIEHFEVVEMNNHDIVGPVITS